MGKKSTIPWTNHTFNVVWGCIEYGPDCANCYARTWAERMGFDVWGPAANTPRRVMSNNYWREPLKWQRDAAKRGVREKVFCGSMCDWAEDHPTTREQLVRLWPIIRATPNLDWLMLTKRSENIADLLPDDWGDGWDNVWLGCSAGNQELLNKRVLPLLRVPAIVHWLSLEPQIGPIDADAYLDEDGFDPDGRDDDGLPVPLPPIDWVVNGGESNHGARPYELEWGRQLRDQCARHRRKFFMKQVGAVFAREHGMVDVKGEDIAEFPEDLRIREWPEPLAEAA